MRIAALVLALAIAGSRQTTPAAPVLTVDGDAAIVTIFVRPEKVAEFDRVLERLKIALAANPARKAQAASWHVFKGIDRVQGNVSYLMRIDPAIRNQEYDIARLIAEADPGAAADVNRSIRETQVARLVTIMNRVNVEGLGQPAPTAIDAGTAPPSALVQTFQNANAGVITVLIRPEHTADYEAMLARVGKSMQTSPVGIRKRQAAGWSVFKGTQLLNGNVAYISMFDPVVPRSEYDPIRLIQEVFPSEVPEIFPRYKAAFAGQAVVALGPRIEMR